MKRKIKRLFRIIKDSFLDKNELDFINDFVCEPRTEVNNQLGIVLIQILNGYYYLSHFSLIANYYRKRGHKIVGLWPHSLLPKASNNFSRFKNFKIDIDNTLYYYFQRKKWHKLYRAVGFDEFINLNQVSLLAKIKNMFMANKIWKTLESKHDVLDLQINDIKCGDLIYDTYLRYRSEYTLDIKDKFLSFLIYKTYTAESRINKLIRTTKIDSYFSSYSTYIQHGIPVRVLLGNNVSVYTDGNLSQYIKKLGLNDYYHTANFSNYKNDFAHLADKEQKREMAAKLLQQRFNGNTDAITSYMKVNAYSETDNFNFDRTIDGVLFLHDFFDSQHIYEYMVFVDFWEWVIYTLNLIKEYNLNVAIKPHPNQLPESVGVVNKLKSLFPDLYWIDSSVSNSNLFKNKIKFGISVYGTVLHELAYHGIVPIAAGDNPHIAFDFVYTAKSIDEYKSLILNANTLCLPKNTLGQVAEFYYMHAVNIKDSLDFGGRSLNLKILDHDNSKSLIRFLGMLNGKN